MGFSCRNRDITRANARYRLAREFKHIQFDAYGLKTTAGYEILFKAFLAWSAFERYFDLLFFCPPNYLDKATKVFDQIELDDLKTHILKTYKDEGFFEFIKSKAKHRTEKELIKYTSGQDFNPLALIAGIRHTFAHGHLTPNVEKSSKLSVIRIVTHLTDFVLNGLAKDFERRVDLLRQT